MTTKSILIAPDKFKGFFTAKQAANIIAQALSPAQCVMQPMADGGQGTADALCSGWEWEKRDEYYVNRRTRTAVIDSSAMIGAKVADILRASSAPLGIKVREIIKGGCDKVIIGVGGTACCDGGLGFLEGLGLEHYKAYKDKLVGLCDVAVPLLPSDSMDPPESVQHMLSTPSALTFARQKGAKEMDYPILWRRLANVYKEYSHYPCAFDGAGGGLGFAIGNAIGAPCYPGAQFVLSAKDIKWEDISLVITGEGSIDEQTSLGKVVSVVAAQAARHGLPCIAIGGRVEGQPIVPGCSAIVSADSFLNDKPLTPEVAEERLRLAARSIVETLS